jgi:hypothetical protein
VEPHNNPARRRTLAVASLVLLVAGGWVSLHLNDSQNVPERPPVTATEPAALTEHLETMRGVGH